MLGPAMTQIRSTLLRPESLFLLGLFVLSIVMQLLLMPACCTGPDIDAYLRIAQEQKADTAYLLSPEAFDGNFWSFVYPVFLASTLWITHDSLFGSQVIHVVLAACLVPLSWLLSYRLGSSVRLWTSAIVAVSPPTIWMGTHLGYEVLLAVALLAVVLFSWDSALVGASRSQANLLFFSALGGFSIGVAALIQSKSLIVLPVVAYLLWLRGGRHLLMGLLGLLLALLPWVVRNLAVLGSPNPLSGNGPYNLWVGNNPQTITGGSMLVAPPLPEGASSQTHAALSFIVSQPESAIDLVFRKAARLWQPLYLYPDLVPVGAGRHFLHALAAVFAVFIFVGLFGFLGARLVIGRNSLPPVSPLAVFVLLFAASHLPFIAEPRFMAPIAPVATVVGVATFAFAFRRHREKRRGATT